MLARDTNLKAAQGQIDISKGNLKLMQTYQSELQERAANYERSGKQPPAKLVEEINALSEQIKQKKLHIERKESDKKTMEKRYQRDLARFRELKSGRID